MTIVPCLWFQHDLPAAVERYTTLFPDSQVLSMQQMGGAHPATLAHWQMLGSTFRGICQPAPFRLNESMSLSISCADQAEVDRYWHGLLDGGGQESMCGWLSDPWGLSWQIVPDRLTQLLSDPDPARADAARTAMLGQRRIVVAELEAAVAAVG